MDVYELKNRFEQKQKHYYCDYKQEYIERSIKKSNRELERIKKQHTLRNFKCVCNLVQVSHEHNGCVEYPIPSLWYLAAEKYCNRISNHDPLELIISMRLYGIHTAITSFLIKHRLWGKLFEYRKAKSKYIIFNAKLSNL